VFKTQDEVGNQRHSYFPRSHARGVFRSRCFNPAMHVVAAHGVHTRVRAGVLQCVSMIATLPHTHLISRRYD
jgi:hypothetical protein